MSPAAKHRERFRLEHAVIVSVLLHLLLVLINPIFSEEIEVADNEPEETVLNFDFDQPAEVPVPVPLPEPEPAVEEAPEVALAEEAEPEVPPPPTLMDAPALGSPIVGDSDVYKTEEPGLDDPAALEPEAPAEPAQEEQIPEQAEPRNQGVESLGEGADPLAELDSDEPPSDEPEIPQPEQEESGTDDILQEPLEGVEPDNPLVDPAEEPQQEGEAAPREDQNPDVPAGALQFDDEAYLREQGFQFGNIAWESGDYHFTDYVKTMVTHLNQVFQRRQWAARGRLERWGFQNGFFPVSQLVTVSFTVHSNGQMSDLVVRTESGVVPLDDAVRETLLEGVFQPLPPDFPRDRETFTLFVPGGQFDIRALIRSLEYRKRAGVF
jgi:hypothetical protein